MPRPFHLGWFLQGSSVQAWGEPFTGAIGRDWMVPDLFCDMARALERACFDYILIEDSSYVGESYGNSRELYLRHALSVPRQDPAITATLMCAATRRIGIVPTFATFTHPPYLLARMIASMDQISAGRIGWNMVTGSSDVAARNYGLDGLPEHDLRYDMADEYMAAVNALWDSWEPGALLADTGSGVMVDHTRVHQVDFEGRWYRTRGPLNSGPCPQGRPVIAQAGGSPRGRQFASFHADTIVASVKGAAGMRAYRADVRARAAAQGRDPDRVKVLFLVNPVLGGSMAEAEERHRQRLARAEAQVPQLLAFFGKITNIDFARYDLDAPVDTLDLHTNGHQQSLDDFKRVAGKKSLREAMLSYRGTSGSVALVGTPDAVAEQMAEVMEEVGGDGFLFSMGDVSRRTIAEVADGLVPALQARGLTRRAYAHAQFRDNLLEILTRAILAPTRLQEDQDGPAYRDDGQSAERGGDRPRIGALRHGAGDRALRQRRIQGGGAGSRFPRRLRQQGGGCRLLCDHTEAEAVPAAVGRLRHGGYRSGARRRHSGLQQRRGEFHRRLRTRSHADAGDLPAAGLAA